MAFGKYKLPLLNRICRFLDFLASNRFLSSTAFPLMRACLEKLGNIKIYHIVGLDELPNNHFIDSRVVRSGRKGYAVSCVSNISTQEATIYEQSLPDLTLYHHKDVSVHYCSDHIICVNERVIANEYLATKTDDNKLYNDSATLTFYRKTVISRHLSAKRKINRAIKIGGKFCFNYYHDVYENLIRLLPLKEINNQIPTDAVILVDEDIVEISSLNTILLKLSEDLGRSIEVIHKSEMIEIDELWSFSSVNFLTPNYSDPTQKEDVDYLYDKHYLDMLRVILLSLKSEKVFPKKLFISRKNTNRRNYNEDEVFSILKDDGFEKISPEEYDIEDQIQLYNNAEWIIGGSGAALTNLIFCSKNVKVLCIIGNTAKKPSTCFSTPISLYGGCIYYYCQVRSSQHKIQIHSNFEVIIEKFANYYNTLKYND